MTPTASFRGRDAVVPRTLGVLGFAVLAASPASPVFGVVVNGEARAYPQRILGWHELARDRLGGGIELTVVYCTLCGTVVPYGSTAGGRQHVLGTSGLLYRSNKLMYDCDTPGSR